MIQIKERPEHIGRWLEYRGAAGKTERGRIKSWNDRVVFVVYPLIKATICCALLTSCAPDYVNHPVTGQKALDAYYKGQQQIPTILSEPQMDESSPWVQPVPQQPALPATGPGAAPFTTTPLPPAPIGGGYDPFSPWRE